MSLFSEKSPPETTVAELIDQMSEKRPLPIGMDEFEVWSDRIISGTLLPGVVPGDMKFALASMLMHLSPTSDHECDGYFIKALRKTAINQIAHEKMNIYKQAAIERNRLAALAAESESAKIDHKEESPPNENFT